MKVNCEIIQDLLPLYEEGLCSPSSKDAVERHLAECESCKLLKEGADRVTEIKTLADIPENDSKAAGGFKRIRRKWLGSLVALLLITCILGVMIISSLKVTCSRETEVWAIQPRATVDNVIVYYAQEGDQFRMEGTYQDGSGVEWYIVSGVLEVDPYSGLDSGFILKEDCVIGIH